MPDAPKSDNKSTLKYIEGLINRARSSSEEEGFNAWTTTLSACKEALNNDKLKGNNFAFELVRHYSYEAEEKILGMRKSLYEKHFSIAKEYIEEAESSSDSHVKDRLIQMAQDAIENAKAFSIEDAHEELSSLQNRVSSTRAIAHDTSGETVIIDPITLELSLLKESLTAIGNIPIERKEEELNKILGKCNVLEKFSGVANRQDILKQLTIIKNETRQILQKLYSFNNAINSLPTLLDSISAECGRSKFQALSNLSTTIEHISSLSIADYPKDLATKITYYMQEFNDYRIAISELDELSILINTNALQDSINEQSSICANNSTIKSDSSLAEELRSLLNIINNSKEAYDAIEGTHLFNYIKNIFNSISTTFQFSNAFRKQLDGLLNHIETADLSYKQGLVDGFLYKLSPFFANSADIRGGSVVLSFKEIKYRLNEYIAYSEFISILSSIKERGSSLLSVNDDCIPLYDDIITSLKELSTCSYAQYNRDILRDIEALLNNFTSEKDEYCNNKYNEYMSKANIDNICKLNINDDFPEDTISNSVELINIAISFAEENSPQYKASISAITRLMSLQSDYIVTKYIKKQEAILSELKSHEYREQANIAKQGIICSEQLIDKHRKKASAKTIQYLNEILDGYTNALKIAEYLDNLSNAVDYCNVLENDSNRSLSDWDMCISRLSYLNSSDMRSVPDKSGYTVEHYLTLALAKRSEIVKAEYLTLSSRAEDFVLRSSQTGYSDAASLLSEAITLLTSALETRYATENMDVHSNCRIRIEELAAQKKKMEAMSRLSDAFLPAENARTAADSHSDKLWDECLRNIAKYRSEMQLDSFSNDLLCELEREANLSLLSRSFERDYSKAEAAILKASKQPFLTSASLWENAFVLCKQLLDHSFALQDNSALQRAYDLNKTVEAKRKMGSKLIFEDLFDSAKKSKEESSNTSDAKNKLTLLLQAIHFAKKAADSEFFSYSNQGSELSAFINKCQMDVDKLYKNIYMSDLINRLNKCSLIKMDEQLSYLDNLIEDILKRIDETAAIDNQYLASELSSLHLKAKDKHQACEYALLLSSAESLHAIAKESPSLLNWDSAEKAAKLTTELLKDKIAKDKLEEARLLYLEVIEGKRAFCLSDYKFLLTKAKDLYKRAINNTGSDSISLFVTALTAIRQAKLSSLSQYGDNEVSEAAALEKECCNHIDRCRAIKHI